MYFNKLYLLSRSLQHFPDAPCSVPALEMYAIRTIHLEVIAVVLHYPLSQMS